MTSSTVDCRIEERGLRMAASAYVQLWASAWTTGARHRDCPLAIVEALRTRTQAGVVRARMRDLVVQLSAQGRITTREALYAYVRLSWWL